MKNIRLLSLVAALALPALVGFMPVARAQDAGAAAASLSPSAAEVVRLAQASSSEEVILAYVQNSAAPFNLSADQILYLRDIGLSSPVITAMLSQDNALRGQPQPSTYGQPPYAPAQPAPAVPQAPMVPPAPTFAPAPAPDYVSSPPADVSYFYSQLSPYGAWVQLEGVGWCWQPQVVTINRAWRPYCDSGHWVYTDAGWYWVSDYSWGWAPFHYGRWQLHPRCGWVWLPDRTWGPAWVTWRTSGDYCGWAPLPPHADFDIRLGWRFNGVSVGASFGFGLSANCFSFIGLGDFNNHDLGHRRLAPAQVTRIYNQTTIINNYVVNRNTIVHQGIPVERVAAATHTQFRPAVIRDLPAGQRVATPGAVGRGEAVVYRSQLAAPARAVNMRAQKVDERHPVIQHAPVAPMRVDRRSPPTPNVSTPATVPRPSQPETPRAPSRPSGERTARPTPNVSTPATAPRLSQPETPRAPSRPSGERTAPPAPNVSAPATAPRPSQPETPRAPSRPSGERTAPPAPNVSTPATTPRPSQPETPRAPSRPSGDKPSARAPEYSAPKPSQPAAVAPPAMAAPRAPANTRPATQPPPQASRAQDNTHPASPGTSSPTQHNSAPAASSGLAPHVYYPKTYHQAAEAHALPPLNAPSPAHPSSPAPATPNPSGQQSRKGGQ